MTRTVLAIMAGLLCMLAGMKYAASLRAEAVRLSRWVQLLSHLALLLQEGTLSIPEAFLSAADRPSPPDQILRGTASLLAASPLLTPADAFRQSCSDCREKEPLLRLFARLGRGSKESRILALEQARDELRLLAQAASARADKDVKLWQTLGLVGGACLTILLL